MRGKGLEINNCVSRVKLKMPVIPPNRDILNTDYLNPKYKKAFDSNRGNKPCFVRISVDSEENVLPFVPGGKANIDSIRD